MSDNKIKTWAKAKLRERREQEMLESAPSGATLMTSEGDNYSVLGPVDAPDAGAPPGVHGDPERAKAKIKAAIRKVAKSKRKRKPDDEDLELDLEPSVTEGGTRE